MIQSQPVRPEIDKLDGQNTFFGRSLHDGVLEGTLQQIGYNRNDVNLHSMSNINDSCTPVQGEISDNTDYYSLIPSSSTSKIKAAYGGITLPAPLSP